MLERINKLLLDWLNKGFFRLFVFLTGRKCPRCGVRKFIGTPLTRYTDGTQGFGRVCFNCLACYRVIGGEMTFDRYFEREVFNELDK